MKYFIDRQLPDGDWIEVSGPYRDYDNCQADMELLEDQEPTNEYKIRSEGTPASR
jgi:hypothetical protein